MRNKQKTPRNNLQTDVREPNVSGTGRTGRARAYCYEVFGAAPGGEALVYHLIARWVAECRKYRWNKVGDSGVYNYFSDTNNSAEKQRTHAQIKAVSGRVVRTVVFCLVRFRKPSKPGERGGFLLSQFFVVVLSPNSNPKRSILA